MEATAENVALLTSAIDDLLLGKRVVKTSYNGRLVEYQQGDLTMLQRRRDGMQQELDAAAGKGRARFLRVSGGKGVR